MQFSLWGLPHIETMERLEEILYIEILSKAFILSDLNRIIFDHEH